MKSYKYQSRIYAVVQFMAATVLFILFFAKGFGQEQQKLTIDNESLTWLKVLPALTFLISIIAAVLNLYVINKLHKSKEEILSIVRGEIKEKIAHVEEDLKEEVSVLASKEQVEFLRTEFKLTMKNIETKIDLINK